MNMRPLAWLTLALLSGPVLAQQNASQRMRVLASLPNWSGLWESQLSAQLDSGEFAKSLEHAPAPPGDQGAAPELALFSRMKILGKPPYNTEWQQRTQSMRPAAPPAALSARYSCSWGFPLILDSPVPDGMFQALVTPEQTLFLFQDGEVRHIYTDGRAHPNADDLWPTAMGDSVGHWEGVTLVIDTIDRKAGFIGANLPLRGADLSEQARFTERLRMIDSNTMQDMLTIVDPARLAQPWQLSFYFKRVTNLDRMIPTDCTENNRNPVVDGKITIAPPQESAP